MRGFATGPLQVGWNGGAQASISTGFIYGALGANNSGYSGRFTMGWGGGVLVGGFGSVGNGVKVAGVSIGANLTTTPAGGVSATQTLPPLTMGNALANPAATPLDQALILARQAVCQ